MEAMKRTVPFLAIVLISSVAGYSLTEEQSGPPVLYNCSENCGPLLEWELDSLSSCIEFTASDSNASSGTYTATTSAPCIPTGLCTDCSVTAVLDWDMTECSGVEGVQWGAFGEDLCGRDLANSGAYDDDSGTISSHLSAPCLESAFAGFAFIHNDGGSVDNGFVNLSCTCE